MATNHKISDPSAADAKGCARCANPKKQPHNRAICYFTPRRSSIAAGSQTDSACKHERLAKRMYTIFACAHATRVEREALSSYNVHPTRQAATQRTPGRAGRQITLVECMRFTSAAGGLPRTYKSVFEVLKDSDRDRSRYFIALQEAHFSLPST
eukprot:scaffold191082_cov36-Tisochrysis_lutea.AAC.3